MATHFEDIGYTFESGQELVDLLNNNMEQAAYYDSADGQGECILLQPDKKTRFWYYKKKDEDFLSGLDLHYQGDTDLWIARASWGPAKEAPSSRVMFADLEDSTGLGIPVCINLVEAPLMGDPRPEDKLRLAVTAFSEDGQVYETEEECCDAQEGFAAECILPMNLKGTPDEFSPLIMLSGRITESTLQRNAVTGKFFYEIAVNCQGLDFTVVGHGSSMKGIPKEGRYFSGTVWLSATVKEVRR